MSTTMPSTATPAPATLWEPRTYPGHLAHLRRLRHDLGRDLAGFDANLIETVQLCASELLANAAKYTDSGLPGGEILRFLNSPTPDRLRLGFTDTACLVRFHGRGLALWRNHAFTHLSREEEGIRRSA